jgi:hypothetical protein
MGIGAANEPAARERFSRPVNWAHRALNRQMTDEAGGWLLQGAN